MVNKYSEQDKRLELVRKAKQSILCIVDEMLQKNKKNIYSIILLETAEAEWKYLINREYSLQKLKQYIEHEDCFLGFSKSDKSNDVIIYYVPDKYLNIWIQDGRDFVYSFLSKYEDFLQNDTLTDSMFSYGFVDAFTEIIYDNKNKN